MKKFNRPLLALLALPAFCTAVFSFNNIRGGDTLEVYLNGKQVHQQFVHADNSTKSLHLSAFADNDKIDVMYLHCGKTGTNRVLTVRNEKGEAVKEFKFADAAGNRSLMGFSRKDIGNLKSPKVNLYYRAKELPEGRLLATVDWTTGQSVAKK